MAAEALKAAAALRGCGFACEVVDPYSTTGDLSNEALAEADVVIVANSESGDVGQFGGKPIYKTHPSVAIQRPQDVIQNALALVGKDGILEDQVQPSPTVQATEQSLEPPAHRTLVAITSCPTGIAHTFMAAEGLKKAATALGFTIFVETQGSVGAKNSLTAEQIAAASAVIIAADTNVATDRFAGKTIYSTGTKPAIQGGKDVILNALRMADNGPVGAASTPTTSETLSSEVDRIKAERSSSRTGAYKSLMSGVSYMLPVVVAGGLSIAISFAFETASAQAATQLATGTFVQSLHQSFGQIGSTAFGIFVAVLSAYIAYSIADRPGIAPGLIGGMLAQTLGAGFLGGIVAGFLAGHAVKLMSDRLKLPDTLEGLKPVLILPFFGSVITGLTMIYVIAPPVAAILNTMTIWLNGMRDANAALLGLLLGAMMAFDMGGPVNKAAYTFAVGLLASHVDAPMAAVMAAGMTPPLGIALATMLFKSRFDDEEREAGKAAFALGLAFITEGAIPFASRDPLRVIPCLMVGSAVAGAISMATGAQLMAPHGGVFAMVIPGVVHNIVAYVGAIIVGSFTTAGAMYLTRRPANNAKNQQAPTEIAPQVS
jgi:PTS system fructose-specific IIC component